MATVAVLGVKINADIKSFQTAMAQMQSQMQKAGSQLRNTGRTLSTTVTLPILGIAGAAIKAASDVEEMQAKFNTVFKTVGGSVKQELGKFAEEVNRSRYELMGFAATFGDIIKPMGFSEESAANMSVTLTKLALDLSSFNNMPMDEAVRRLRGTLIGAHENAAEFGVIINENTLKQELMRMGAEDLTGAQKEQAKVQARLNLLLAGTTDAQGDAARTSDSFANQMRGLMAATKDLGIEIGEMLLPYATELIEKFKGVVEYVEQLSPETKRLAIIMVGVAAALGPVVFILGGVASAFSAIFSAMALVAGLINPWTLAFAALAAIGIAIYRNWDAVKQAFVGTWTAIKDLITNLKDNFINTWVGIFKSAELALKGDFEGAWTTLKQTTATGAANVVTELSTFGTDIGAAVAPAAAALMFDPFALGDPFKKFKDSAKSNLDTDEDSVTNSASAAQTALGNIKAEVSKIEGLAPNFTTLDSALSGTQVDADDVDAALSKISPAVTVIESLKPSFKTLEDALSGAEVSSDDVDDALNEIAPTVASIEGLAPDFATLTKALGSETLTDKSLVVMSGNAVSGIKGIGDEVTKLEGIEPDFSSLNTAIQESTGLMGGIFDKIPDTLTMPEGYEDIIKDVIPDKDETHRWSQFVVKMGNLKDDLNNASHFAFKMSGNLSDVEEAWRPLFGTDSPQWMKDLVKYATDASLIVQGLESMVTLLEPSTWTDAYKVLKDLGGGLWNIVTAIGEIIVKIGQWIAAQIGLGGGPDFTGGAPGISIPGSGGSATTTGAGMSGGAGLAGLLSGATVGATFGIFAYGLQQMLTSTHQSLLEQGLSTAQVGTATSLGGLLQGVGSMGSTGGGTPSWLSGLQGYMGTGGSANTSGFMSGAGGLFGSGSSGSQQTINVNLDGQTIASATMPYWSQELEIYGTNR